MYVIKDVETGNFAKHTGETINNERYQYVEYPWELVDSIDAAQQYTTLEHANEIAFWHLDHYKNWLIVDTETGEEYEKKTGKYLPV